MSTMKLRPLKNKRDYQTALKEAEHLRNAPESSADADRLEVLVLLVQAYETRHFPIADPDPIDFLNHVMESRGLTRKDLEPYIGSRARVAEVLNRVRPLSFDMIRRLSAELKIPAEVLIQHYPIKSAA